MRLTNTAEGQADTTVLTAANSGSGSGDAFTQVDGTAITFSSTTPAVGSRCYKVGSGTGTVNAGYWQSLNSISLSVRFWVKFPQNTSVQSRLISFRNTNTVAGVLVDASSGPKLAVMQGTSLLSGTLTPTLSLNTWYRVELAVTNGLSGTGTYKFRVKNASLVDVAEFTGAFTGPNGDNFTIMNWGRVLTSSNFGGDIYFDDITLGDSADYLGDAAILIDTTDEVTIGDAGFDFNYDTYDVDPVGLTDDVTVSLSRVIRHIDPVGITDDIALKFDRGLPVIEPVGITDYVTVTVTPVGPGSVADVYRFCPPTIEEGPAGLGPLFGRYRIARGISILVYEDGIVEQRHPTLEQVTAAIRHYLGGHEYYVTGEEGAALIAAGYGAYLTPADAYVDEYSEDY